MKVTTELGDATHALLTSVSGLAAVQCRGDALVLEVAARMCACAASICELQVGDLCRATRSDWGRGAYSYLSDAALLALAERASRTRPVLYRMCEVWRCGIDVEVRLALEMVESAAAEAEALQAATRGEAFESVAQLWGGVNP